MNALPTSPYEVADLEGLQQYFLDIERFGFDIACITCRAIPYKDITGSLESPYRRFASEAKAKGCKACIRIHSSISAGDVVGVAEAQHNHENGPGRCGDEGFYASLASSAWRNYLKDLTRIFIEDYGYDWVIFDEPTHRFDIPGTLDRFYHKYLFTYPDLTYPTERAETPEYLKLQRLKAVVLLDFCKELTDYAKEIGAEKVGIMPRPFIPAFENASGQELSSCCESRNIAALPGLDFLVTRMDLGSVYAGYLKTGDEMSRSPAICYAEALSHCVGKHVIAMISPTGEYHECVETPMPPNDFIQKAILASTAAAPNGLMVRWLGRAIDHESIFGDTLAQSNRMLRRIGKQRSPLAFVTSGSGFKHAEPYSYESVWQFYWQIMRQFLFVDDFPALTFSAEAIEQHLAMNPHVSILVLEEHFPLTLAQMLFLEKWWTQDTGKAIIVVGGGMGYSADPDKPGLQPISEAFPGLLAKIGIKQDSPGSISITDGANVLLKWICCKHSPLLSEEIVLNNATIANVHRVFGSHNTVVYSDPEDRPIIAKWASGKSLGFFCGIDSHTAAPIVSQIIKYILRTIKVSPPVATANDLTVWNGTKDGYVIIANCSGSITDVTISRNPCTYWDVMEQQLVKDTCIELKLHPMSMRVFRWTNKASKLYDVVDAIHISSIISGAGRAEISLTLGKDTIFIVRNKPREVQVDGFAVTASTTQCSPYYKVHLPDVEPGNHVVSLRW